MTYTIEQLKEIQRINSQDSPSVKALAFAIAELEARDRQIAELQGELALEVEDRQAREETWVRVRQQAARECAEIASQVSNSYDKQDGFPSYHAVGAETVAVTIRNRFGLPQ